MFIQQEPIVVEVLRQPDATRDISADVIVGMFSMAGVALVLAALGGLVVGGIYVAIRRHRAASAPPVETEILRLRV